MKLCHYPPRSTENGPSRYFLASVPEPKPQLEGMLNDDNQCEDNKENKKNRNSGRLVFSSEDNAVNVLKIIPVNEKETNQINTMPAFSLS